MRKIWKEVDESGGCFGSMDECINECMDGCTDECMKA